MSRKPPNYEVGYRKPPKGTQFKKGQSGNPQGRPSKPKELASSVRAVLDQKVSATIDGRNESISMRDVVSRKTVEAAARGNLQAINLIARFDGGPASGASPASGGRSTVVDTAAQKIFVSKLMSYLNRWGHIARHMGPQYLAYLHGETDELPPTEEEKAPLLPHRR